ncbi:TPA: hypothetical protein ACK3JW_001559 [Mannheimia haemolytica]
MFKEKGYDEFLCQSIQKGNEDLSQNKIVSREQALMEIRQTIIEAEKDLAEAQQAFNGVVYG